jgi:hypothetical protein
MFIRVSPLGEIFRGSLYFQKINGIIFLEKIYQVKLFLPVCLAGKAACGAALLLQFGYSFDLGRLMSMDLERLL